MIAVDESGHVPRFPMIDGYIGVGYRGPVPANPLKPVEVQRYLAAAEWVERVRPLLQTEAELIDQLGCSYETLDETFARFTDALLNNWEGTEQGIEEAGASLVEDISQYEGNEPLAYQLLRSTVFVGSKVVGGAYATVKDGGTFGFKSCALGLCGVMNIKVKGQFVDDYYLLMERIPELIEAGVLPPEIIDLLPAADPEDS
jgi:hypothetical protein